MYGRYPSRYTARSLRNHRELILNSVRAQKLPSSGVVEGLNNKAKVTMRNRTVFEPTASSNSPSSTHLASCPNRSLPTISSDEQRYPAVQIPRVDTGELVDRDGLDTSRTNPDASRLAAFLYSACYPRLKEAG